MFDTYEVAKQLVVRLHAVVPALQREDRDLADQLKRAASSVVLNLAEGQRFDNAGTTRSRKAARTRSGLRSTWQKAGATSRTRQRSGRCWIACSRCFGS